MNIAKNACVVIPMHNEEEVLESVITRLLESFENIIVVNDGSTDGSSKILQKLNVTVLTHCINLGQGAAITTAFSYLAALENTEILGIVTCDADGQHSPDDVVAFANAILNCEEDIILGSRFLHHKKNIPFIRRQVLSMACRVTNLITGVKLTDTHNGLKAMKISALRQFKIGTNGYAFETELISEIGRHKLKYREMPTNTLYTEYSINKGQTLRNGLIILEDLLRLVAK